MVDFRARPSGWPERVPPPGAVNWERWAVDYLWDCCPADFRRHEVLRRFPVVLAWFARRFVEGQEETSRRVLPGLRVDLVDRLPPTAVERAVEAWQAESAALARTVRAVRAIENALRDPQDR